MWRYHEGNLIYDIISYFIGSCIPYSDDAKIQRYILPILSVYSKKIDPALVVASLASLAARFDLYINRQRLNWEMEELINENKSLKEEWKTKGWKWDI